MDKAIVGPWEMSCWFEPWIFTWKSICMFFHFLSQGKYIVNVWGGESKMQVPKFDNRFKHLLIIWSHYKVFCLESLLLPAVL